MRNYKRVYKRNYRKTYRRMIEKSKNNKAVLASGACITIAAVTMVTNSLYGNALDSILPNTGNSPVPVPNTSISSTTSTSSTSPAPPTTTVSSMSSEEMDKIIKQITEAASSPDYTAILDQVIERAILMGNAELQQYAENKKAIYAAQSQINEQNAMNAALAAKNPDVKSVNSKLSEIENSGASNKNIIDALPQRAGELFATLDDSAWATLSDAMVNLSNVMDLKDPSKLSENDKNLLCAILCQEAIDKGLFKDDKLTLIQSYQKAAVNRLESAEESGYSKNVYSKLKDASQKISLNYKNAKAATPSQIILYNQKFKLKNPVIIYGGTLMIAVNDAYQFIDATYTRNDHNATIAINSNNVRLEITAGKNTAFINDKSATMSEAMINFDNVYYIPVEFFASTYDVKYSYSKESQVIIMYDNLNQLENKSTANKLTQSE